MSPRSGNATVSGPPLKQAVAFAVHASRNFAVQAVGLAMVVIATLHVTPWPYVAGWAVTAIAVLTAEDWLLRRIAEDRVSRKTAFWAPALRIAATTLYALGALALIARGGGPERLFAFALMTCSMVNVLMRYYRSPWILMGALSPYVAILALLAFSQVKI